jgi:3-hydroxyacyl-CoA dehydrogenase
MQDANTNENAANVVAIVGAGLVGRGWAIVFARNGWHVNLFDVDQAALSQADGLIAEQLRTMAALGLCADADSALAQVHSCETLSDAVGAACYVQECGPETVDFKRRIFDELDQLTPPNAILASSTSGIMASKFSRDIRGRHRVLVVHPVNPPHLVPLVEISPAPWTSEETASIATDIMTTTGQVPIRVNKEIPGFILNRLQGALLNEAVRLATQGYASADDIDKTIREGLGLRWSFMGPFETIDLNAPGGLADYADRFGAMYSEMAKSQSVPPDWSAPSIRPLDDARRRLLSMPAIPERQAWRDRRLAELIAHKRKMDAS